MSDIVTNTAEGNGKNDFDPDSDFDLDKEQPLTTDSKRADSPDTKRLGNRPFNLSVKAIQIEIGIGIGIEKK